MPHDEPESPYPDALVQNPAPHPLEGQDYNTQFRVQVNKIMATFLAVLPDNYVTQVNGPFYSLQFQAIAEALAEIQLTAQQSTLDADHDFTRTEFLWEILGTLVFPGDDIPVINGDITYRDFLRQMVRLLLQGSTKASVKEGVELISGLEVEIVERFLGAREPQSAWGFDEQFQFEVNVEGFPSEPFITQENVRLVLEALKPAHTLYEYRHIFRDAFEDAFDDTGDGAFTWELAEYRYDDFRKFCYGAKEITGTGGDTLTGRFLFSDPTLSLESVTIGAVLIIAGGANDGRYEVTEAPIVFPVGDDTTARAYTTSPTGLTGTVTVSGDVITDTAQDFAAAVEGEILTLTAGPNAGSYRLEDLLGPDGGPLHEDPAGPGDSVRVAPSIVRVRPRMLAVTTGQTYTVTVDRLGVRTPKTITDEDASEQFYL